jgi:hypothetical protein
MGEQEPNNSLNTLELYKIFPFLDSFPFEDYAISLEKDTFNPQALGIDPMIVNNVSGLEMPDVINFFYVESDSKIMISFYTNDISYLKEKSVEIKSLDSIRKNIDTGLQSLSIIDKIDSIKKSTKFIKLLNSGLIASVSFNEVFLDMLKIDNIELSNKTIISLQNMSSTVKEENFTDAELQVIRTFYNFRLHYVKILLGVIISAKIY